MGDRKEDLVSWNDGPPGSSFQKLEDARDQVAKGAASESVRRWNYLVRSASILSSEIIDRTDGFI